jgi:hypothetical protein
MGLCLGDEVVAFATVSRRSSFPGVESDIARQAGGKEEITKDAMAIEREASWR